MDFMDRFTQHVYDVIQPAMDEFKKYCESRGIKANIFPQTETGDSESKKIVTIITFDIKHYKDYQELRLTYTPDKASEKVNYSASIVASNGARVYDNTGNLFGDCTIEQIDKKSIQGKIAFLFRNTGS